MNAGALTPFIAGFAVAFAATPVARSLALRYRVLDHPSEAKPHTTPTPYLGGLALLAGVGAGGFSASAWDAYAPVLIATVVLVALGLADDVRPLRPATRLAIQAVVAAVIVAGGVRAEPTGIATVDSALSVLWLVGITNAFNLLDNMNGLSAGVAAVTAACFFIATTWSGQQTVGILTMSIAGAALGFLPHNFPRARIFMGDAGSLSLGFLLGVVSLEVRFPAPPPWSIAAPICMLGLAIVDTTVVVVDRVRSGRRVSVGGCDHLSHRLVALGLSRLGAVGLLLAAAAELGMAGALAGHAVFPPATLLVAGIASAAVGLWLLKVPVAPPLKASERRRFAGIGGERLREKRSGAL